MEMEGEAYGLVRYGGTTLLITITREGRQKHSVGVSSFFFDAIDRHREEE